MYVADENDDIKGMTTDELIEESKRQRKLSRKAESRAKACESEVINKFLREHNLDGTVLHKKTGRKGVLRIIWDICNRYTVDFYPIKKDGKISKNKSLECTEWATYKGLEWNFEKFPEVYEPVKESD